MGINHYSSIVRRKTYKVQCYCITGVGGSNLGPECPCGEVNRCAGSPDDACNSDLQDGQEHEDSGWFIHKQYLPVSKVCEKQYLWTFICTTNFDIIAIKMSI